MTSIGSIVFNNDLPDTDGTLWYCSIDGWDTLAQRVSDVSPPGKHGGITVENLYEPRQLTVTGLAVADDTASYYTAKNLLATTTSVLNPFVDNPLLITVSEDIDRYLSVLRTSWHAECIDGLVLRFELTFRADDPLKRSSVATTVATSGNAINAGTAVTWPTFTLTAPGTPTLTAGALTWSATAALAAGTVIDMGKMSVMNSSTSYFGNVDLYSDWIYLPPGTTAVASNVAGTWSFESAWL